MLPCKQCSTLNTLDSMFCRKCGVSLEIVALHEAQVKLDKLVAEGVVSLNEARVDEALEIAETALRSNPTMIPALSLLSDSLARKGQLADALSAAEKIVELSPDSELDKIKRNQLRVRLQDSLRVPEGADRRTAILAAISAVVLVVCLGAFAAKMTADARTASITSKEPGSEIVAGNYPPAGQVDQALTNPGQGSVVQTNPAQTNSAQPNTAEASPQDNGASADPAPRPRASTGLPRFNGGTLPGATGGPIGDIDVVPINPGGPPNGGGTNSNSGAKKGGDPEPEMPQDPETPVVDPGEISIIVKTPAKATETPNKVGGSTQIPVTNPSESGTFNRVGNEQFQTRNFEGAAKSFERASNGGNSVKMLQRKAQALQNANKPREAIAAYEAAIVAGEAALKASPANASSIQAVINTSRQAINALKAGS